jgi:hypothetical protein
MRYKEEIDIYTKRKHQFKDNMNKVYSLIFLQHCNKTIQERITGHPEFESKIKNDPIELLKAIEILINDPVRARYPYASMTESITRFMTCRKQEYKSLTDYVKRFKSNRDGPAQTMGKDFLKKFKRVSRRNRRRQAERYVQHSLPKMDGIHAKEEQRPRKVWLADDGTDNAVLHGCKHVPRNRCEGR